MTHERPENIVPNVSGSNAGVLNEASILDHNEDGRPILEDLPVYNEDAATTLEMPAIPTPPIEATQALPTYPSYRTYREAMRGQSASAEKSNRKVSSKIKALGAAVLVIASSFGVAKELTPAEQSKAKTAVEAENTIFWKNFEKDLNKYVVGFDKGEVVYGWDKVNFKKDPIEAGANSFRTDDTSRLSSPQKIELLFESKDPKAIAVKKCIIEAVEKQYGKNSPEMKRVMSGQAYVPVQMFAPAVYHGTSFFNRSTGKAEFSGHMRGVGKGDIVLFATDHTGHIISGASARENCRNCNIHEISKVPPNQPIPSPFETPAPTPRPSASNVPSKFDDGRLPGDGTPASQGHGTPGNPGNGPAGQSPNSNGVVPGEQTPTPQQTSEPHPTSNPQPTPNSTPSETNPPPPQSTPEPGPTQPPNQTDPPAPTP